MPLPVVSTVFEEGKWNVYSGGHALAFCRQLSGLVQPLRHAALDVVYALQQLLPQSLVGRQVLSGYCVSCRRGNGGERHVASCRML
jgi:hypothetical protein